MTSKECLKYIAEEKGVNKITGAIECNWKLYQPCFKKITQDLERLEKLEDIFRKYFLIDQYKLETFISGRNIISKLTSEEWEVLKEVFDND